jgi:hypothetical protein
MGFSVRKTSEISDCDKEKEDKGWKNLQNVPVKGSIQLPCEIVRGDEINGKITKQL